MFSAGSASIADQIEAGSDTADDALSKENQYERFPLRVHLWCTRR